MTTDSIRNTAQDTGRRELLALLVQAVGAAHVLTDPDVTEQYRRDMQPLVGAGRPLAVVRPACTSEVAAVIAACTRHGVPVVPRGAGSGMTGAANAQDGAVTILTSRMTAILTIDAAAGYAVVQPGVITLDLIRAAEAAGMFYAPDPTSSDWCTIGGNLANGSGGPHGSKYGVTADAVLALEVVLASGRVLATGRHTLKGVTGYDLNRLFVGSEGTLGFITQATLRLTRRRPALTTAVAAFASVEEAGRAVTDFIATGQSLALLEIMDQSCFAAVETHLGSRLLDEGGTPAAVLFAQSDSGTRAELAAFEDAARANGAILSFQTDDPAEGEMIMGYWRGLEAALEPLGTWILHEVTVPRDRLAALILSAADIAAETGVFVGVHGHAQDGTVHPMIVYRPDAESASERAGQAYRLILQAALDLGGPVTGEHGIGRMKTEYLADALGEVGLEVHRAIKAALDPGGTFNPGSMFSFGPEERRTS
ncbi:MULTISPECIES: FAD-binding oxidoreductase [Cryobacterium]|uniref:FAD-binding protein n=1 Tax=Cryobacterium shii TaxID=1259235 RepID=A0AAQ2C8F8_9MICO|nr:MULTISPECIES: FAD-linked oxidase C-terminal domain-containing protein [Cryobacterium]TFC52160.1 FAD-binding protein [Cryobacterium shii]TFD19012.1 FAD-binding protein [Cryobacterium sp. TMT2-23]